jgi:hypothetical protein
MVKAHGVGLKFLDFPEVKIMNMDPTFLKKMVIEEKEGKLEIPVTHIIPASIMGSGLGASSSHSGDYDIQLFDEAINQKYGLDTLRFGDIVAIVDADHSYGRIYKQGAISVGIVVHSNCIYAGHGPGVTTLFTSSSGMIEPKINPMANIASILSIGTKG